MKTKILSLMALAIIVPMGLFAQLKEHWLEPITSPVFRAGFDSLNTRFIGNWPFGCSYAVVYDSVRQLVFCSSGGGSGIKYCGVDFIAKLNIIKGMAHRYPAVAVDVIIEVSGGIVLIKRKNPPYGWAIPGGFIDYGESAEHAAKREAKEETGLDIENLRQFHTYSEPNRDPRGHTISIVFTATAKGKPKSGDDAVDIGIFTRESLPADIAFDHREIIKEYFEGMPSAQSNL